MIFYHKRSSRFSDNIGIVPPSFLSNSIKVFTLVLVAVIMYIILSEANKKGIMKSSIYFIATNKLKLATKKK